MVFGFCGLQPTRAGCSMDLTSVAQLRFASGGGLEDWGLGFGVYGWEVFTELSCEMHLSDLIPGSVLSCGLQDGTRTS